jgi:hypothetical protein
MYLLNEFMILSEILLFLYSTMEIHTGLRHYATYMSILQTRCKTHNNVLINSGFVDRDQIIILLVIV